MKLTEESKQLEGQIASVLGVIKCSIQETDNGLKVSTTYNCEILKGRELADIIEKTDPEYKVINDRIDSFSKGGNQ